MQHHTLETDFLVAGGGMAGVCAAIAAARQGAKVVLVQNRSVLGGNASSEIRMHIVGADAHGQKPGARETGLLEEIRLLDAVGNPQRSPAMFDLLLLTLVTAEPNITLMLDTDLAEVDTVPAGEGMRRIVSARALRQSTEDEFEIRAVFFADCTGDGRMGAEAGADFVEGRESREEHGEPLARDVRDRHRLGSSIMFMARQHDRPMPFRAPPWARRWSKEDFRGHRDIHSYEYGYWWFEWGGHLDTIKDDERIRRECQRIALGVWDYVKNSGNHPDAANWALDWVAPITGKRESRRFVGESILTQHDVLNASARPDAVAYGGWPMDLHPPEGVDAPDQPACTQHWFPHLFSIPYGCYHSRNIENLFFAGRNISATHVAFASTRVMGTCAAGGQAVGMAAAQLIRERKQRCSEADVTRLRRALAREDAFLPGYANDDPEDLARRAVASADSWCSANAAGNVLDGIARDLRKEWGPWSDGGQHCWRAATPSASLRLDWREAVPVRTVRLTFDTGLHRELILSGSDRASARTLRSPQPECVRSYLIKLDGRTIAEVRDNLLRHRVHELPAAVAARTLTIECLSTHGGVPPSLYEVRAEA